MIIPIEMKAASLTKPALSSFVILENAYFAKMAPEKKSLADAELKAQHYGSDHQN